MWVLGIRTQVFTLCGKCFTQGSISLEASLWLTRQLGSFDGITERNARLLAAKGPNPCENEGNYSSRFEGSILIPYLIVYSLLRWNAFCPHGRRHYPACPFVMGQGEHSLGRGHFFLRPERHCPTPGMTVALVDLSALMAFWAHFGSTLMRFGVGNMACD